MKEIRLGGKRASVRRKSRIILDTPVTKGEKIIDKYECSGDVVLVEDSGDEQLLTNVTWTLEISYHMKGETNGAA